MATCDVRSTRPVEHSPSSITLALFAISAALQLLLFDGASAVQEPQLPDEHARVVYRPEILSLRTEERRFYVPLRRKQGAFESVAGDAVSPPSNCNIYSSPERAATAARAGQQRDLQHGSRSRPHLSTDGAVRVFCSSGAKLQCCLGLLHEA